MPSCIRDTPGEGGGRDATLTSTSATIDHIDRGHLALSLDYYHAGGLPRLQGGEGLDNLCLRGNRVSEEGVGTAANQRVCDSLITLHQFYFFLSHTLFLHFFLINSNTSVRANNGA